MRERPVNTIELPASEESFKEALLFFRQRLDDQKISKEIVSETMLVLEALFHNLLEQNVGPETTVSFICRKSMGTLQIKIAFEGKMAYLYSLEDDDYSPEDHILRAYEDRIGCNYHSGYNTFQINVKRNQRRAFLSCAVGILLAVVVYFFLSRFTSRDTQHTILGYYIMPIEQLFGNAALMVGTPVTFFSLLKNLMATYILADRYSGVRKLRLKAIGTAVIMILLAVGMSFLLLSQFRTPVQDAGENTNAAIAQYISEAVPYNIFTPFESFSPIPLIILSFIVTFALSSAGQYFVKLKNVVDVGYTVFSRMLNLVLYTFPFFFFVSTLDLLLLGGLDALFPLACGILLILAGTPVVLLFYLIRLKIGGVTILPFLKKLPPLLLENLRINSSIDAVPFNIRYCVRHYGMNRKRLERSLPALAQTMFDGNCYTLMSVGLFLSFELGESIAWYRILVLAMLVIFLSLGAPNQPGTFLVGTMIILRYFGYASASLTYITLVLEASLGVVQNLINVVGDIVTVTVEEEQMKIKKKLPEQT